MPHPYDELEGRVTAVERELGRVREDAAAARALASGADRDVSLFGAKLDAHTKVLSALRETQLELDRKVDDGFARIDQEFALVNQGFAKVEDHFAKLGAGMAHITALLERNIESE